MFRGDSRRSDSSYRKRERGRGWGWEGGAELWNINGENRSPILEKEKLPVQNIPGNEWQNRII